MAQKYFLTEGQWRRPIRLTESDIHRIVKESIKRIITEGSNIEWPLYISDSSLNAMEKAFCNRVKGSDILNKGVTVLRGKIDPEATYREEMGVYKNSLMPGDIVVEYPDGKKHTLIRK